jgi:hypothetical protein
MLPTDRKEHACVGFRWTFMLNTTETLMCRQQLGSLTLEDTGTIRLLAQAEQRALLTWILRGSPMRLHKYTCKCMANHNKPAACIQFDMHSFYFFFPTVSSLLFLPCNWHMAIARICKHDACVHNIASG